MKYITIIAFLCISFILGQQYTLKYESMGWGNPPAQEVNILSGTGRKYPIIQKPLEQSPQGIPESIQDIITYRDKIGHVPYILSPNGINNSGGIIEQITLNIDTIIKMHSDMNAVLREGAPSGTYTLRININSPQSLDMEKVQNILEHFSNAQEVSIVFYEFPENYYEIFRTIPWKKSTHMTLSIWLYSTQFPYNFTMEDILSESKKMVLRNNGAMPLGTFVIEGPESSRFSFVLDEMEEALLKNFPTQYFASNIVLISGAPRGRDDMHSGKERVETFFHESSIEKIEIQNVGMKNSKDIHLLGF